MKPLCIDLFCGLGGWAEGFLAEGWDVIGFDIERHDYGTGGYPGQLVLQDVLTLHGSQFRNADVIVASPPCQAYSYRAMPWKRAKALPPPDNTLFEACFRIQRESSEAAGRHIPMVVENVCGAQKWVGRAAWHFGSYYLWGDVPALMPSPIALRQKFPAYCGPRIWADRETPRLNDGTPSPAAHAMHMRLGQKNKGGSWFNVSHNNGDPHNPVNDGTKLKDHDGYERTHPEAFGCKTPRTSSRSDSRKAVAAQIAKIPFPLAQHIARVFKPLDCSGGNAVE